MDPNLGFVSCHRRVTDPPLREGEFRPAWRPAPMRQIIEDQIERLIAFLDMVDGDCDLEDSHDAELEEYEGNLQLAGPS
jgi:hypothetical protein